MVMVMVLRRPPPVVPQLMAVLMPAVPILPQPGAVIAESAVIVIPAILPELMPVRLDGTPGITALSLRSMVILPAVVGRTSADWRHLRGIRTAILPQTRQALRLAALS